MNNRVDVEVDLDTKEITRGHLQGKSVEQQSQNKGRHALVLGGSLAGLLAARVLTDHYDRVTIVERDSFPTEPVPRRGVPQMNHVHALLVRGRLILEQLFPGLNDEMMSAGAPLLDMADDLAWLTPLGWGVRFQSDLRILSFTRPLLDFHVRWRLAEKHHVHVLDNTEVVRLLPDAQNKRLSGVLVRSHDKESQTFLETELLADLVVDATGRGSQARRWLTELGHTAPEETVIDAHIGYASRLYRKPANSGGEWRCSIVQAAPPKSKRGGLVFEVEGNRWLVTLLGGGFDYPPTTDEEFIQFARSLASPIIYEAIRDAEPLTPIRGYRATENRLRHFERAARLPENFLAVGDSVCAFNPVYGQGMTIAAIGALTLHECLSERTSTRGLARQFQERLAKVNEAPWMLATSQDLRYRETVGGTVGLKTRFMHKYMDYVLRQASFDTDVRYVLLKVFSMLAKPSALFHPQIVISILVQMLGFVRARAISTSNLARSTFRLTPETFTPENNPQNGI
jgi:2-polyprenyl-6-methoxyphenol hydroxylase-like FAD-dependent oxidoreductase